MPAQYTAIKNSFRKKGMEEDDAQTHAAKIYVAKGRGGSSHSRAMNLAKDRKPGKKMPMSRRKRPVEFGVPK